VPEREGARRWASPDEKIIVHISNFRPVKRVQDVVEVFRLLLEEHNVRLLMVGDGPERPKVEQRCRELGICSKITFIGNLPLVEEVLVGADLFLLPSETESFGLAALEALSCRVPVIATAVGGLPEVVLDGKTGFLLPKGDVEGMARAAAVLLDDDAMRQEFGDAARNDAVERFAVEKVVQQYRDVYNSVLAQPSLARA
jgi:N-acetyl-alpha-D-glucosaminyl L-malate synthase BshA